jgi:hypothetical protein
MQNALAQIPVFHIEDEPDWMELIQNIVNKYINYFEYVYINASFDAAVDKLSLTPGPAIVLWDLRLNDQYSEYQTPISLAQILPMLADHCFENFVLSGFLHETTKLKLVQSGIPENHIFEKGRRFSKDEFLNNLLVANNRIRELNPCNDEIGQVGDEVIFSEEVCEITTKFVGFEDQDEPLLMKPNKKYELRLSMRSLLETRFGNRRDNISFDVAFYCSATEITPSYININLPDQRNSNTQSIDIVFNFDLEHINRNFYILVYHNNALLQSAVFSLKIDSGL